MMKAPFLLLALAVALTSFSQAATPPNIVIILADDMGWGDAQCYNPDSKIATPHLDRMAKNGMRFTDAHTPSSVCTPTRYTLLTGRYCWRTRLKSSVLDGFSPPLIAPDRATIGSFLKTKGYATACIGKWHLGMQWTRTDGSLENMDRGEERGFRPGENIDFAKPITSGPLTNGFDSFFGISASLDMPPYCWIENDLASPAPNMDVPTARDTIFLNQTGGRGHSDFSIFEVLGTLKKRTVKWLDEHHETNPDQPFFLYLPLNSPHLPVSPGKEFQGKSQVGHYGDFMMETDDFVGGVLDTLEKNGDAANTLVLFTADNGGLFHQWEPKAEDDLNHYKPTPRAKYTMEFGHQSNAQFRGTKADIWEGGHRVPFLIQWPATVKAGQVSDAPVELTDVFSTVLDIAGSESSEKVAPDSFSFLPVLQGKDNPGPGRPYLVHHSLRGLFAVRRDEWKFIEERGSGGFSQPRKIQAKEGEPTNQLYDMKNDPQETKNLAGSEPEKLTEMKNLLEAVKTGDRLPK